MEIIKSKKQQEVNQKAKNVQFDEDYENIVYDEKHDNFGGQYDYYLKQESKGNGIDALYKLFIEDGNLVFEDMNKFTKALELAGIENVEYLDPYKTDSKVYEVYLNVTNPFNTNNTEDIFSQLKEASKTAMVGEQYSADVWDKSNISPEDWISRLESDLEDGTTQTWTIIPDWVTNVLKSNGYDGIRDTGGKNGGITHEVIIPFCSEQIKNVDNTNPTTDSDIRYSQNNSTWQEHLEKNYKATGTRTDMQKIRLPKSVENNTLDIPKSTKTLNPTEISKLTKEDANTTPLLPKRKVETGNGRSKFYDNATKKSEFLSDDSRGII